MTWGYFGDEMWITVKRGTSLIRNRPALAPYSRFMFRALWWSLGWWRFLMSEVPLYGQTWLRRRSVRLPARESCVGIWALRAPKEVRL